LVVAARFDVTFGAVSQHLRVLEDAGLVSVRRDGRRRLYQARREQLGPLRAVLEAEPEPARRVALLERCLSDGGRFRGALESCHGVVRFRWAAIGPGEAVLATGTNVAGADLDGRFRWVTGFWDPPPDRPEPPQRP
jgi:DNA-binding transcriptional ArsR family regulator